MCSSPEVLNQLKSDGQNAFFIETSGSGALNIRQVCRQAVESLAFHNPNLSVTVLFMDDADGDMMKFNNVRSSKQSAGNIIEKLKDKYSNIQFIIANLNEYMAGTSMEKWYHCNDWRQGPYRISHLMKSYCGEENLSTMDFVSCRGFSALPASTFSPIWWGDWQSFFSQRRASETRAPSWITKHVVGVHIWNKMSFNEKAYTRIPYKNMFDISFACLLILFHGGARYKGYHGKEADFNCDCTIFINDHD